MVREINNVNPTIIIFLELLVCVYCKVERPNATINAHVKHKTEAAKASGIEARRAPTFPVKGGRENQSIDKKY